MIFTFVLLLQLVFHFNVEGKHYLVETKDERSLEELSPVEKLEKLSPVGQVIAFTLLPDQKNSRDEINQESRFPVNFLSYISDAGLSPQAGNNDEKS